MRTTEDAEQTEEGTTSDTNYTKGFGPKSSSTDALIRMKALSLSVHSAPSVVHPYFPSLMVIRGIFAVFMMSIEFTLRIAMRPAHAS